MGYLLLFYKNGQLEKGLSRGDGKEEDITLNILLMIFLKKNFKRFS